MGLVLMSAGVFTSCGEDQMNSFLLPGKNEIPKVIASYPAAGAQGIDPAQGIWILFSAPMDEQKTQTAFRLSSAGGASQGAFRWELSKMFFVPRERLSSAGEYTMIAGRGSESTYGLDLEQDFVVRFFAGADSGKPGLLSSTPSDGDTGVANTSVIALTFSEPMDFATALSGISISPSFIHGLSQNAAQNQILITPHAPLVNGTVYTVTAKTSLKDLSGNPLAAEKTISFTVGSDTVRPAVTSIASGGSIFAEGLVTEGIERSQPVLITFSEPMEGVSTENAVSISPSVNSVKTWISPSVLQIQAAFNPETNYTISLDTTAADGAGNNLVRSYSFPFYTNGVDSVRPVVMQAYQQSSNAAGACTDGVSTVPGPLPLSPYSTLSTAHLVDVQSGAGATCVIELRLDFSRNMDRTSLVLAAKFLRVIDPSNGSVDVHDIQVSGNVVLIQLSRGAGTWPYGSGPASTPVYKLRISGGTSGAKDVRGNALASDYELYLYF